MKNKKRKGWIAGVLTFCAVGLGHIYSGEPKRGITLFLCQGFLLLLIPLIFIINPLLALSLLLITGFVYFIFCLVDSIKYARSKSSEYQLKKYNKWYIYFAYWLVATIIIQPIVEASFKENVVQAYKIPSGAMLPTLLIGDHILVNKYLYKKQNPQRGDIAVFEFPNDLAIDYIKRIVAVGGDSIEIKDKKLYINGNLQSEEFVTHTDNMLFPVSENPRDNFGPFTVPPNAFFFLGDNRDNSYDSRFWGVVEKTKIKGKAFCFYWSWDKMNSQVRWDRIGELIEK